MDEDKRSLGEFLNEMETESLYDVLHKDDEDTPKLFKEKELEPGQEYLPLEIQTIYNALSLVEMKTFSATQKMSWEEGVKSEEQDKLIKKVRKKLVKKILKKMKKKLLGKSRQFDFFYDFTREEWMAYGTTSVIKSVEGPSTNLFDSIVYAYSFGRNEQIEKTNKKIEKIFEEFDQDSKEVDDDGDGTAADGE